MEDGRPAILRGERQANWRWTRGYVENVAAAIALAATDERAAGQVYNIGEQQALAEANWVRSIGEVADWSGAVVVVPESQLPDHLRSPYDWSQDLVGDTAKFRWKLGYQESVSRAEALRRTVAWERSLPAREFDPKIFDYEAEDKVLQAHR